MLCGRTVVATVTPVTRRVRGGGERVRTLRRSPPPWFQFSSTSQPETWITSDYSTCCHFSSSLLPRVSRRALQMMQRRRGSGSRGRREGACCVRGRRLCCDNADAVQNEQLNQHFSLSCLRRGFFFFLPSVNLKQFILFFLRFFIIRNLITAPDLSELKQDRPSWAFLKSKTSQ